MRSRPGPCAPALFCHVSIVQHLPRAARVALRNQKLGGKISGPNAASALRQRDVPTSSDLWSVLARRLLPCTRFSTGPTASRSATIPGNTASSSLIVLPNKKTDRGPYSACGRSELLHRALPGARTHPGGFLASHCCLASCDTLPAPFSTGRRCRLSLPHPHRGGLGTKENVE